MDTRNVDIFAKLVIDSLYKNIYVVGADSCKAQDVPFFSACEECFSLCRFNNQKTTGYPLKGQSHEKFGEMRVWGLSLGHN
jgi:hypothetical protein